MKAPTAAIAISATAASVARSARVSGGLYLEGASSGAGKPTFGTFGLAASLVPQRMSGAATDHVADVGFDTQYEFVGARDSLSLQATSPNIRTCRPAGCSVSRLAR
jgi:hypothetical protein